MVPKKAMRQLNFARAANKLWPSLGDLHVTTVEEWKTRQVDLECPFWKAGQSKYFEILMKYFDVIGGRRVDTVSRLTLLSDLGFHLIENAVTEHEEAEMLDYW